MGNGALTAASAASSQAISAGELLVSLPGAALVTTDTACAHGAGKLLADHGVDVRRRLEPNLVLALFLMFESRLPGSASAWTAYLRTIPTEYTTPPYWTEAELAAMPRAVLPAATAVREN